MISKTNSQVKVRFTVKIYAILFTDQVLEKAEASWEAADKCKTEAGWCLDTAVGPGFP